MALAGSPLIQPIPPSVADVAYGIVTSALGLDKLSPTEQVKALLEMPAQELSSKLSTVPYPLAAVLDNDIVKAAPTYTSLANPDAIETTFPGIKHCKTILMNDCQFDGMIIGVTALAHRNDNLTTALIQSLETVFPNDPAKVSALKAGYGLDPSATDTKAPVLHFINDIGFAQAAKATAQAWTLAGSVNKAYLAHFNMPNPWPGAYQGHASHALDAAMLLGNYNTFLSAGQRACAERLAGDVISLAYGKAPFPMYASGTSMVYYAGAEDQGDGSQAVRDDEGKETGRRTILEEVAAGQPEVLDKLLGAFGMLLQGPK